jgi:C_GCAxxG_C_C family probable redox protein
MGIVAGMDPRERAADFFLRGYNCAQSTAAAFAREVGLDEDSVIAAMAGFGAGLGGLRGTCGPVSAMAYLAGLRHGGYAPDDLAAKQALYDLVKRMVADFTAEHGTTECRALLEKTGCVAGPNPSARTPEYYAKRPCVRFVESAAGIVERRLFIDRSAL